MRQGKTRAAGDRSASERASRRQSVAAPFVDQYCHEAGPSGLVRGAQPLPRAAVEVFVEQDQIAPVRVVLELPLRAIDRPPTVWAAREHHDELARHLPPHGTER